MNANELVIYTDGGCIGNPGPGGWAAVLVRDGKLEEIGGCVDHTTNNRMEMRAAIEGLGRARPGERVRVVTDSRYLLDGISRWIHACKRRGWRKADGNEVLNRDLWEDLDALCRRPRIPVVWDRVRGHAGDPLNERCDELANAFARGRTPELKRGDGSWILGTPSTTYPVYASLVDGELCLHPNWPSCEVRVKGAKGARHRKLRNAREHQALLEAWGVVPEEAGLP